MAIKRSDKHKTNLQAALIEPEAQFTGEPWTFVYKDLQSQLSNFISFKDLKEK